MTSHGDGVIELRSWERVGDASAGAFACDGARIAQGFFGGRLLVRDAVDDDRGRVSEALFAYSCNGVVWSDGALVCLGQDREIFHDMDGVPGWDSRLVRVDPDGLAVTGALRLPGGNWSLVRGSPRGLVVLHDTSFDQGVIAVDAARMAVVWRMAAEAVHHPRWTPTGTMTALTRGAPHRCIEIDVAGGNVLREVALPGAATWTAAVAQRDGTVLLGSHIDARGHYLVAAWAWGGDPAVLWGSTPEACFTEQQLFVSRDDECCGNDVDQIADLAVNRDGSTALVAIGGDGDRLGACQGACRVGLLSLGTGAFRSRLVDDSDGCSGVLPMDDGAWLVDCGGTLRALRC